MIVRTTMRPDVDVDVSPQELVDLTRWGLVADTNPVPSPDETPPAEPSSAPTPPDDPAPSTEETS